MAIISVIIPCYNVEQLIDRCLASVIQQTIGINNLEIICIDDASTDRTWEHLQAWHELYPENIKAFGCATNSRQGTARNIGLRYSTTPWICFIDSDDWVEPDYLEKLYSAAVQTGCEIVTCQHKRDSSDSLTCFDDRSTTKENRALRIDTVEKRKILIHTPLLGYSAWGKLIQKNFLLEHNIYFPEMLVYEDGFWGVLLHLYVKKAYIIEECLYHYYVNPSSTVLNKDNYYHVDMLTVQMQLWAELKARNMFELYHDELEYEFLFSCYLSFLKVIALRYETPPYSLFQLLKTCTLERIPDYRKNKYVREPDFSPVLSLLLESLSLPLGREEFLQFAQNIKNLKL